MQKKKPKIGLFKYSWFDDPKLANWLRPVKTDETKAHCIVCNKTIVAYRRNLLDHEKTSKHQINACNAIKSDQELSGNIDINEMYCYFVLIDNSLDRDIRREDIEGDYKSKVLGIKSSQVAAHYLVN